MNIVSARASTGATINGLAADTTYIPRKAWLPYYTTLSGTSMAIPHVAGTVALVEEANPALVPDGIERVITATARPIPWYRVRGGDRLPGRLQGRREGESATLAWRPARQARRARPSRRGGL